MYMDLWRGMGGWGLKVLFYSGLEKVEFTRAWRYIVGVPADYLLDNFQVFIAEAFNIVSAVFEIINIYFSRQ